MKTRISRYHVVPSTVCYFWKSECREYTTSLSKYKVFVGSGRKNFFILYRLVLTVYSVFSLKPVRYPIL